MDDLRYQLDLLKAMNQKLQEKEKVYRLVCESIEGAYLYVSMPKNEMITLGKWHDFFDFDVKDSRDFCILVEAVQEEFQIALRDAIYPEKRGQDEGSAECRLAHSHKWMRFRTIVYRDELGTVTEKIICVHDVTKMHSQNDELQYMAYFDDLTGLYSRNFFVRKLGEEISNLSNTNGIISIMLIDIDEFRKVNDGIGILVGDELVQQFGMFLKSLCDKSSHLFGSHLHTDVFCLAIVNPTESLCTQTIHQEILNRTSKPFLISSGENINITVSIGVAEYPEAANTPVELLNCAEIMVHRCKEFGPNTIQYYTNNIRENFLQTIELENRLKKAIQNYQLEVYYQPQYYAGNQKLRGAEALLRWRDEKVGMVNPSTFIPVAEKNGYILPLGKWVVEESIRQYAKWKQKYGISFTISINISALQYKEKNFVLVLMALLEKYQVEPKDVELEITESILIEDFEGVCEKLIQLTSFGIRIALDDFGTGYSSLSYLKKLPITTLKIDKSFVDTVLTDAPTRIITESIIRMGKALGFISVAEGVEQERQYEYLHSIGCDVIQGYYFSQALPADEFEKRLEEEW